MTQRDSWIDLANLAAPCQKESNTKNSIMILITSEKILRIG